MGVFGDLIDKLAFWRDDNETFEVEGCFTLPDESIDGQSPGDCGPDELPDRPSGA